MNTKPPAFPVEDTLRQTWGDIQDYVHREPAKAALAAFVVGLSIGLLPTRWVAGAVTVAGSALLRPTLLLLGVSKVMELSSLPPVSRNPGPEVPHEPRQET